MHFLHGFVPKRCKNVGRVFGLEATQIVYMLKMLCVKIVWII